jgi:hypothetical protein
MSVVALTATLICAARTLTMSGVKSSEVQTGVCVVDAMVTGPVTASLERRS